MSLTHISSRVRGKSDDIMDFTLFKQLIKEAHVGKKLPDAIYLHRDALKALPEQLQNFIPAVAEAVSLPDEQWNLIKLFKNEFMINICHDWGTYLFCKVSG